MSISSSSNSCSLATARGVQGKTINTCKGAAQARLRAMEAQAEAARKAAEAEALIEAELAVIEECETPRKTKARRQLRRKDTFKARRKARAAKAQAHIEPTRLRAAEGEPIQNKWATPEELDALRQAWGADKRYKDRNPKPRVENIDLRAEVEVFGITKDEFDEWWAGYHRNCQNRWVHMFEGLDHTVGRLITAVPGFVPSWEDWCNGQGAQAHEYLAEANNLYKAMVYVASKANMPFKKWHTVGVTANRLWFDHNVSSFSEACNWLHGALPYAICGLSPVRSMNNEELCRLGQVVASLRKDEIKSLATHIRKNGGLGQAMHGRVGVLSGWYSACRVWKYAPYLSKGIAVRMSSLSPKALKWFNYLAKEILHGDLREQYEQKVSYANLLDADQQLRNLSKVRHEVSATIGTIVGVTNGLPENPVDAIGYLEDQVDMLHNLEGAIEAHTCFYSHYMSAKIVFNYTSLYLYGERDVEVTLEYINELVKDLVCLQYDQLDRLFALPTPVVTEAGACHIYDWCPPASGSKRSTQDLLDLRAKEWLEELGRAVEGNYVSASLDMFYGAKTLWGRELCAYAYMLCDNYVHGIEEAKKLLTKQSMLSHESDAVTEVVPYKGYVAISCSPSKERDEHKWQPGKGVWAGATGIVDGYGDYANLVFVNTLKGKRGSYQAGSADSAYTWLEDFGVNPGFNGHVAAISFKSDLTENKCELSPALVRYLKSLQSGKQGVMPVRGELARVEVTEGGGWKAFLSEVTVRGERGIPELVAFAAGDLKTEKEAGLPLKELFLVRLVTISLGFAKRNQDSARAAGYRWLGHYALGTGSNKVMPDEWVRPWLREMVSCADANGNFLWSSDRWQGCGFDGRPHGFYTVGGFSGHYDRETGLVTFKDVYDWHPMKRTSTQGMGTSELWCWSEMDLPTVDMEQLVKYLPKFCQGWAVKGLQKLGVTNVDLHALTERLLGSQYYGHSDFFGVKGLSNKLWHDLTAVGAKPFTTTYRGRID